MAASSPLHDSEYLFLGLFDGQAVRAHGESFGAQLLHQGHGVRHFEASFFEHVTLLKSLARRGIADELAVAHDEHVIGQPRDVVHIVGDEHDRDVLLLVQVADGRDEFLAAARVEAGDGLVEHEVLWLQGEHARDGDATHLAARQRKR